MTHATTLAALRKGRTDSTGVRECLEAMAPPQSEVHRICRVSDAERREIMEIVDRHNDEYRTGLDKVGPPWDRDDCDEVAA